VLIATYVTGSSTRDVTGVAVDASGIVYATRRANSGQGSPTAEILKLSNDLSTVLASTTTASGTLNDVNVDASGRIYAAGHTQCGLHGGCSGGGTYEDESGYIYNSTLTSLVRLYWPVSGRVNAIAVNPAGGAAVSQVNGSEAVLGFGLSNNNIQWTYTGHSDEVLDMAYDRNGNLFTASEDGTIHQLNATNGQFIQSFDLGSPVFGVAVAPGQPGTF
jgi:sugar lactone lactonase YvrE